MQDFFASLSARAQALVETLGAPGLLIVAFIDSSFLTLPEVADLLVILLSIRSPAEWPFFALMTTAGSVMGSYALFAIGRKGGEALLKRQFHERHIDRGLEWYRRFGIWVLVVPAVLPPPTPFKLFVLLAGVAGIGRRKFIVAVAAGRGFRYSAEAYLATLYGEDTLRFLQRNVFTWILPAAGLVVLVALIWWAWRRRIART
jgi:membrane protein YqaA with SNARE-associated domain